MFIFIRDGNPVPNSILFTSSTENVLPSGTHNNSIKMVASFWLMYKASWSCCCVFLDLDSASAMEFSFPGIWVIDMSYMNYGDLSVFL